MPEDFDGGIPMSDGAGDAVPDNVDSIMAGGEPNQDRVPFGDPVEEPIDGTEIHEGQAPAATKTPPVPDQAKAPGDLSADPVIRNLQAQIAKLTPEQRAALSPAQPVEIVHNGEKLAIPPDKQVPLMQMGLNYSEKMRQLNVRAQEVDAKAKETSEHQRYYGEIDKVAKANPDWWRHVQASYQKFRGQAGNVGSGDQGESTMTPVERELRAEINELKGIVKTSQEQLSKEATLKQAQAEDHALDTAIADTKKLYADFDWLTADASGQVLEDRILAHADKHQIHNFQAAAVHYLFPQIKSRLELKVKEDFGKTIVAKTKAGVVTPKARPTGLRAPTNMNQGYEALFEEGLAELG